MATAILNVYWRTARRLCVLCREGHHLELRLYDGDELVAMWPCSEFQKAKDLAEVWRRRPPAWPPEFD